PNLDALPGQRRPVARAAYGAAHPETALADPVDDLRALDVVVGPARHRRGWRKTLRPSGQQQEPGNAGYQHGATSGDEVAAGEYRGCHVNSSWRPLRSSPRKTATARYANLARSRPNSNWARGSARWAAITV